MTDRYEHITERLVAIEEELRDLAYESLREVARSPDSDEAAVGRQAGEAVAAGPAGHRQGDRRAGAREHRRLSIAAWTVRTTRVSSTTPRVGTVSSSAPTTSSSPRPPKCGTTWTQMICALLVFQTTSFHTSLDLISPWLDMLTRDRESVCADLDAQTHRRFIKTHTPLEALPYVPDVTYICVGRDPRDVFRSSDNHMENMDLLAMITAAKLPSASTT